MGDERCRVVKGSNDGDLELDLRDYIKINFGFSNRNCYFLRHFPIVHALTLRSSRFKVKCLNFFFNICFEFVTSNRAKETHGHKLNHGWSRKR